MTDEPRSAPDFTTPTLIMLGVNLFWILYLIWSLLGFALVVIVGLCLNSALSYAARRAKG